MALTNQTSVASVSAIAVEGQIAETGNYRVRTYVNNAVQTVEFTISAANTETTITINGNAYTESAGGGETKAEIAISVAALINAGETKVTATPIDDVVKVVSDTPGTTFTYEATANTAAAETISNTGLIKFGRFVTVDPDNPEIATLPNAATDITSLQRARGFTSFTQAVEGASDEGYVLGDVMNVIEQGAVWVKTETDVTVTDTVYVRHTANGSNTDLGIVRNDNDSNNAAALSTNHARFETNASAGKIVKVLINLV